MSTAPSYDYSPDDVVVRLRCGEMSYDGIRISYHRSKTDGSGGGSAVIGGGLYPHRTTVQLYLPWARSLALTIEAPGTPSVIVRRYKPECREADEARCSTMSQILEPRPECDRFAGLGCGFSSITTVAKLTPDDAGAFPWPVDLPDGQYLVSVAASLRRSDTEAESAIYVFPVDLSTP